MSPRAQELSCSLLLDYKFILLNYDINNTRSVGLEICTIGK